MSYAWKITFPKVSIHAPVKGRLSAGVWCGTLEQFQSTPP